eukprot:1157730-Pelagomonas_calceolata.AAC.6
MDGAFELSSTLCPMLNPTQSPGDGLSVSACHRTLLKLGGQPCPREKGVALERAAWSSNASGLWKCGCFSRDRLSYM